MVWIFEDGEDLCIVPNQNTGDSAKKGKSWNKLKHDGLEVYESLNVQCPSNVNGKGPKVTMIEEYTDRVQTDLTSSLKETYKDAEEKYYDEGWDVEDLKQNVKEFNCLSLNSTLKHSNNDQRIEIPEG